MVVFFEKETYPTSKKYKKFFGLYTKTHIFPSLWLEKREGLTSTINGPKARFQ